MKRETDTIDAAGMVLGRLAVQIAVLLRGKHRPSFLPYKDMGDFVVVKNAGQIKITGSKLEKKVYYRHSGYLGGLKELPLKKFFEKDPGAVLKKAVLRMLPATRLRIEQIKRLKVER